jgi:hypothetical protein
VQVCPVECIPLHPDHVETREQLQRKYHALMAETREAEARAPAAEQPPSEP